MSPENSTIVRPEVAPAPTPPDRLPVRLPPRAPWPVRAGFTVLDTVSPHLSARIVDHLWFRLPKAPPAQVRRDATPAGGTAFTTVHDGLRVHGWHFGPDDAPTAHLVHGWAGWWQQLAAFVDPLLAAGYRVVAHDAPSHGDSPAGRYGPRSSRVMEIADAYAAVVRQQGPADLVVAHSLGAMATMWARRGGTAAGAYAFLAATASVAPMVDYFRHSLGLSPRTPEHVVRRVERRVGHPFAAFEVTAMAAALEASPPVPPLLAVHDRNDRMAPAQGSVDVAAAWPGAELLLTENLGHARLLRHEATVGTVVDFAVRHRAGTS